MMTRAERLKLARAARALASEYVEGRGPEVTNSLSWCGCLAGVLVKRANVVMSVSPAWVDNAVGGALSMATSYIDSSPWLGDTNIPLAPVLPLLWLADELESAR